MSAKWNHVTEQECDKERRHNNKIKHREAMEGLRESMHQRHRLSTVHFATHSSLASEAAASRANSAWPWKCWWLVVCSGDCTGHM